MLTLVVVAECSPFRASIDTSLAEHATARTADGVAAAELFDEVWWLKITTWLVHIFVHREVDGRISRKPLAMAMRLGSRLTARKSASCSRQRS